MKIYPAIAFGLVAILCIASAHARNEMEAFSKIPAEKRDAMTKRLDGYTVAYRQRKWEKLYDFVSSTGRGGVDQKDFVTAMKAEHGTDFAQMPDLLEFRPELVEKNDKGEFDVYGCGKARREGMIFNGVAITHAVLENNQWFFTGWRFTEFPNEPCTALSEPNWRPANTVIWGRPMEEVVHFKSRSQ
jgi:hypothetical protein